MSNGDTNFPQTLQSVHNVPPRKPRRLSSRKYIYSKVLRMADSIERSPPRINIVRRYLCDSFQKPNKDTTRKGICVQTLVRDSISGSVMESNVSSTLVQTSRRRPKSLHELQITSRTASLKMTQSNARPARHCTTIVLRFQEPNKLILQIELHHHLRDVASAVDRPPHQSFSSLINSLSDVLAL